MNSRIAVTDDSPWRDGTPAPQRALKPVLLFGLRAVEHWLILSSPEMVRITRVKESNENTCVDDG